jgi:hypothetical protein
MSLGFSPCTSREELENDWAAQGIFGLSGRAGALPHEIGFVEN